MVPRGFQMWAMMWPTAWQGHKTDKIRPIRNSRNWPDSPHCPSYFFFFTFLSLKYWLYPISVKHYLTPGTKNMRNSKDGGERSQHSLTVTKESHLYHFPWTVILRLHSLLITRLVQRTLFSLKSHCPGSSSPWRTSFYQKEARSLTSIGTFTHEHIWGQMA